MSTVRINLDRLRCSSIGICESIAPDYFEIGDDTQLILLKSDVDAADEAEIREAVRSCPAAALRLADVGD